jgi:replicative DNA helicase
VKLVKQESQRRELTKLGHSLLHIEDADVGELLEETAKKLDELNVVIEEKPYIQVGEIVGDVATSLINGSPRERGIPTYLSKLDYNIGSIEPSDYWVIAGRPGMGKTAMALSMMYQQACNGYRVGMVTMDMSKERLTRRLLCHERDAHLDLLVKSRAGEGEMRKITEGAVKLHDLPIFIADVGGLTVSDLERRVRMMVNKDEVQIVYIDYLQQVRAPGGNREQEVAKASATVKALCKNLGIPIIALAQLNRSVETRDNKEPRISDLRESGAIEQDAEIILFPYREEHYDPHSEYAGTVKVIFGKARDSGAISKFVRLAFIKQSMRFADLEEDVI